MYEEVREQISQKNQIFPYFRHSDQI
jgi:hypothetical protein